MRFSLIRTVALAVALSAASCAGFSAYKYRQTYAMIAPVKNFDGFYSDHSVSFQFDIFEKKINVLVSNMGDAPVLVEWPGVKYIDPEGARHDVANSLTMLSKDGQKPKPSVIPVGGAEENLMVPADHQERMEQWTWYIKPLFNLVDDGALLNLDKTFSVIIPVKVGEEKRIYTFQFKVASVMPYNGRTPG